MRGTRVLQLLLFDYDTNKKVSHGLIEMNHLRTVGSDSLSPKRNEQSLVTSYRNDKLQPLRKEKGIVSGHITDISKTNYDRSATSEIDRLL
jgi:hypothetical protein